MQEDVLGTRKTVVGETYETCSRCGEAIPPHQSASPHQAGEGPRLLPGAPAAEHPPQATQEAPPPRLCPACAREVASGEALEGPTEAGDPSEGGAG